MKLWELMAWMDGWQMRRDDGWRMTREVIAAIYNAQGAKVTGTELIPLLSDKKEEAATKLLTLDEKFAIGKKYENVKGKKVSVEDFIKKIGNE